MRKKGLESKKIKIKFNKINMCEGPFAGNCKRAFYLIGNFVSMR